MPRLTSSARQKVMHALQSTKQKQQFAMATTTRSFPVSTTTQHDVHAWQAGQGEHLALSHHTQNLELTATRSQVKHESTHRRDSHGSTRLHTPCKGCITCLLNLSQPTVTTSQGVRRPLVLRLETAQEPRAPDAQPPTRAIHHQSIPSASPVSPDIDPVRTTITSSCRRPGQRLGLIRSRPLRLAQFSTVSTPTRSDLLHS